jgi:long-chain acyl-CoA synthetase
MANLHGTLFRLFEARGDRIAFSLQREQGGYRAVSARRYREESLRLSAYLRARGVGAGDRVLLLSENGPEWTMAALAVMNLGAVVVPIASIATAMEVRNTYLGAQPKFSLLSRKVGAFRQVEDFFRAEAHPFLAWDLQEENPLAEWTEVEPAPVGESVYAASDAIWIYTSGTTGSPKGVPISHANILANAEAVLRVIQVGENDRLVGVLPLSHMLEFTGGYVLPALIGAPVTYVKSLKAEDLLQALKDSRATFLIAVPLLFEVIARNLQAKLEAMPGPLPRLFARFAAWTKANPGLGKFLFFPVHRKLGGHIRYLVAGGSRLQPATYEYFQGLGITILQGYGLTETSPVLSFTSPETAGPDHVGQAIPGVELGIFDDKNNWLPPGREGEIWARGPNIFRGYLDPEQSKSVFHEGWFRTGDLGVLGEDGILRITGRKKDIIVTGAGKNVYPEEIESVVLASGAFLEACALGVRDQGGHERVALVLVPDRTKFPGKSFAEIEREARQIAAERARVLADYKWPQKVEVFFEEMPKTNTRKIKKHEVRKILLEREESAKGEAKSGDGLDLTNELERTVADALSGITKVAAFSIRSTDSLIKDLGLDSLTFVELISHVEKKFNVHIEGVDFANVQTVADLLGHLQFAASQRRNFSPFSRVYFVDFPPAANQKLSWRIPRAVLNRVLRAYVRSRHFLAVEGLENLGDGPYVFTPNHSSHFDLLSIASSLPPGLVHRTFAVAAKDYFFNRSWKAVGARLFVNAIPFDRRGRVDESMRKCREALDGAGSLVIFPEGTRSPDGRLQEFKPGVGQLLAGNPAAKAVPVFIDGAHEIMPKGSKFPAAGKLRVRYGKPISFAHLPPEAESYRIVSARLREAVEALARN